MADQMCTIFGSVPKASCDMTTRTRQHGVVLCTPDMAGMAGMAGYWTQTTETILGLWHIDGGVYYGSRAEQKSSHADTIKYSRDYAEKRLVNKLTRLFSLGSCSRLRDIPQRMVRVT